MVRLQEILQKWRVKLGHVFALAIIFFAEPRLEFLLAGTLLAILGESLRIYSAGIINKDQTLSRLGPYSRVRNPLYVGTFLMSLGFCLCSSNIYMTLIAFPLFFFPVYYSTIFREEAFLREKFGEEYARFCREVPRFLPSLRAAEGAGRAEFSWEQVKANKEYQGLGAAVAIVLIMWIMWALKWNFLSATGIS